MLWGEGARLNQSVCLFLSRNFLSMTFGYTCIQFSVLFISFGERERENCSSCEDILKGPLFLSLVQKIIFLRVWRAFRGNLKKKEKRRGENRET